MISLGLMLLIVGCATKITSTVTPTAMNSPSFRPVSRLYMSDDTPVLDARRQEAFFQAVRDRFSQCGVTVEQSAMTEKSLPAFAPFDVKNKVARDKASVEQQRIRTFQPDDILFLTWKDMTVYKLGGGVKSADLVASLSETGSGRKLWTATIAYEAGGVQSAADFGSLLAKHIIEDKMVPGCLP